MLLLLHVLSGCHLVRVMASWGPYLFWGPAEGPGSVPGSWSGSLSLPDAPGGRHACALQR